VEIFPVRFLITTIGHLTAPRHEVFLSFTGGLIMRDNRKNCSYVTQRKFSLSIQLVLSNKVTYRILLFFSRFQRSMNILLPTFLFQQMFFDKEEEPFYFWCKPLSAPRRIWHLNSKQSGPLLLIDYIKKRSSLCAQLNGKCAFLSQQGVCTLSSFEVIYNQIPHVLN
jgi:hypothetical protein